MGGEIEEKIENSCIVRSSGDRKPTVDGDPLTFEFQNQIDPKTFCDEIRTIDPPWEMFGIKIPLENGVWKVAGNLLHIGDECGNTTVDGSSKITIEVSTNRIRIYTKDGFSAQRVAKFIQTLHSEYEFATKLNDG